MTAKDRAAKDDKKDKDEKRKLRMSWRRVWKTPFRHPIRSA